MYQGRPGGLLWIDPTVEATGAATRGDTRPMQSVALVTMPPPHFRACNDATLFIRGLELVEATDADPPTTADRRILMTGMLEARSRVDSGDPPIDRRAVARARLARRRRNTELTLIIMAGSSPASPTRSPRSGRTPRSRPASGSSSASCSPCCSCAHIVVRLVARGADGTLLPLAALLHGIGFVMITRLDDELAELQATVEPDGHRGVHRDVLILVQRDQRPGQLPQVAAVLSVARACCCQWSRRGGQTFNGARIWVSIGSINFQPGEFAKIALAIFFAAYFAERRELIAAMTWKVGPFHLPEPRYILPIIVAWGFAVIVMVGERDLGSSLLFFTLFVVMMWVATETPATSSSAQCCSAERRTYSWSKFAHVQTRVTNWIDPWDDRSARGTRSSSRCMASPTAASSAPASAAATRTRCPRRRTTSSSPRSARSSA